VLDPQTATLRRQRPHLATGLDLTAGLAQVVGERLGNRPKVDDPGPLDVQGGDAADVRLDLVDLAAREAGDRPGAVRARSALELVEARQLLAAGGDDQLAAAVERDPAGFAEPVEEARAAHAELRLQRARLVIDAGVDHAGVGAGLDGPDAILALEDADPARAVAQRQLAGDGEADDSAADDRDVASLGHEIPGIRYSGCPPWRS
jgi:hypothetical protein